MAAESLCTLPRRPLEPDPGNAGVGKRPLDETNRKASKFQAASGGLFLLARPAGILRSFATRPQGVMNMGIDEVVVGRAIIEATGHATEVVGVLARALGR